MTALAIIAVAGWVLAILMWIRANGEQDRADRQTKRAKAWSRVARQTDDLLRGERSKNAALRSANDRLYHCLRDHMDADEYAALQQGVTVFDRTLADFDAWESEL